MPILYSRKPKTPKWIPICGIACALALLALMLVLLAGCKTTALFVPDGSPVRLRETIKGARVWVQNERGAWIEGKVDLPAGWYCLSNSEDPTVQESRP